MGETYANSTLHELLFDSCVRVRGSGERGEMVQLASTHTRVSGIPSYGNPNIHFSISALAIPEARHLNLLVGSTDFSC